MKRKKYEKGFLGCGRPNLRLMQKINEYIISHNLTQELDPHRSMKRNIVNMNCDANMETGSRKLSAHPAPHAHAQSKSMHKEKSKRGHSDEMCDFFVRLFIRPFFGCKSKRSS